MISLESAFKKAQQNQPKMIVFYCGENEEFFFFSYANFRKHKKNPFCSPYLKNGKKGFIQHLDDFPMFSINKNNSQCSEIILSPIEKGEFLNTLNDVDITHFNKLKAININ